MESWSLRSWTPSFISGSTTHRSVISPVFVRSFSGLSWYVHRLIWNAIKFGAHQDRQSQLRYFTRQIICNSDVRWTGQDDDQFLGHIFFFTQLNFFRDEFVMEYATCTKKSDLFMGYLRRCFNYKGQVGRKVDP
jgi:hypothetical protein